MFSSSGSNQTVNVSIKLVDGSMLHGELKAGMTPGLEGILSKDAPFLEFLSKEGQRKFISKHQVAYVEQVEQLRKLSIVARASDHTNAHDVLGLQPGCNFEDAKIAYHEMAKMYHPDVVAGANLPPEVTRYMNDMFRQINSAFAQVKAEIASAA